MFEMGERIFPGGVKGSHGYPGDVPEMAALFVAHGPAFRRGVVIPDFDNVNVYPLLAALLGVKAERNDGDLAVLASALIAPRR
jgi:predicted AlkP superfamily pyrophosphatase or phosphodiesterase